MDHLVTTKDSVNVGITGDIDALVINDTYSGLKGCYPSHTKDADSTAMAIRHFPGRRCITQTYADESGEIKAACNELGVVLEESEAGVPHTNGVIERCNGIALADTRAALVAAGIPACCWPHVSQCVCFNDNAEEPDKLSAWALTHGKEFPGKPFPFGCGV